MQHGVDATSVAGSIPVPAIVFTQINLHHSKGASAILARRMAKVDTGICLIQEPWICKGKIAGLNGCGTLICGCTDSTRTCILVKGLQVGTVSKHCSRDLTTAKISYKNPDGAKKEILAAAAYFPYEGICPPKEVEALVRECEVKGHRLILGCDVNAHHTVWGSCDSKLRGEKLLEFLATTNLN